MLANDIRNFRKANYISHGWGKKPEQKAAEKKYNHEYYMKHKKEKGKGKQLDEATSGVTSFAGGGLIGVAGKAISEMTKTEKEKEIAAVPCNVLIYNEDDSDTDPNGSKYIAKVKLNGMNGSQYWKYFYTDYQIQTYQNLVNKITDNRDNSSQSGYLDSKSLDELDELLLRYDLKREPMTEEEDAKLINPNYDDSNPATSMNCIYCTEAYCMRRMGFDVVATERKSTDNEETIDAWNWRNEKEISNDIHLRDYTSGFARYYDFNEESAHYSINPKDVEQDLLKEPDGSYGALVMVWDQYSGHAIVWEKKDGKVIFRDTQDIHRYINTHPDWGFDYYQEAVAFDYIRLDNQLPEKSITSDVIPRESNKYGSVEKFPVSDKEKYKPGLFEKLMD